MKRRITMKSIVKIISIITVFATNFSLTASTELAEQNAIKAKIEYCQETEHLPELIAELKNTKDPKTRENLKKRISNLQHEEKNCKDILKKK